MKYHLESVIGYDGQLSALQKNLVRAGFHVSTHGPPNGLQFLENFHEVLR